MRKVLLSIAVALTLGIGVAKAVDINWRALGANPLIDFNHQGNSSVISNEATGVFYYAPDGTNRYPMKVVVDTRGFTTYFPETGSVVMANVDYSNVVANATLGASATQPNSASYTNIFPMIGKTQTLIVVKGQVVSLN